MNPKTILVVDDEEDIQELINYNLSREGYKIIVAGTGEQALQEAQAKLPDLIILDLMLPGLDGLDVCKILKNHHKTQHIPVIMLTAKGEESDIVTGLEIGADDYITKPFSIKVLIARVRSAFRKKTMPTRDEDKTIKINNLVIDTVKHVVLVANKPVPLTLTEFKILYTLAKRPGAVMTRYQIVDAVHGQDYPVTDRSIDVQIVGLRKKLGVSGKLIQTIRGIGYKFKE